VTRRAAGVAITLGPPGHDDRQLGGDSGALIVANWVHGVVVIVGPLEWRSR